MHPSMTARQIAEVLSTRAANILAKLNVHTVAQLGELNPAQIKPVLGAGPKTIREIVMFQESVFGPYKHSPTEEIKWYSPDTKFLDGLEEALVGLTDAGRYDEDECPVPVYDSELFVKILMDRGMIREDAENHLKNSIGNLGENDPVFLVRKRRVSANQENDLVNPLAEHIKTELLSLNPYARFADYLDYGLVGFTDPAIGCKPVAVYDSGLCAKAIETRIKENAEDEDDDEVHAENDAEDELSYDVFRSADMSRLRGDENTPVFYSQHS